MDVAERLAATLELSDLAEQMKIATLRRKHPDATDEEVQRLLEAWYAHRPGAEHGDAVGRVIDVPRDAT